MAKSGARLTPPAPQRQAGGLTQRFSSQNPAAWGRRLLKYLILVADSRGRRLRPEY
jgi:hypothetical protein